MRPLLTVCSHRRGVVEVPSAAQTNTGTANGGDSLGVRKLSLLLVVGLSACIQVTVEAPTSTTEVDASTTSSIPDARLG
jgi:hypothetical protein